MSQRFWNQKLLMAKIETVYGTDAAPTGAADAILASQVKLMPMEGQDVARELERPFHAADPTLPADLHAKISFRVELAPSGTAGTAPGWAALMRGCGCAQTLAAGVSVTFSPISTGYQSLTMHLYVDGIRWAILGARGTFKLLVEASGIPYLEFTFTGRFAPATDAALPAGTLTAFKDPLIVNAANTPVFTIDAVPMVMKSLTFDAGCQVEPRFWVGTNDIIITGRAESLEATVEVRAMATFNPYTRAANAARIPIVLTHGTVAGARATLNVPSGQMQRPGEVGQTQNIAENALRFVPQPTVANDQWTLVLT